MPPIMPAAGWACRSAPPEAIAGMIGGGERKFMERLVGPAHQALTDDCLKLYLDYYSRHCGDLTRLYPGVPETLEKLAGKKLAVLSNKLQRLTEQVLAALGLARCFAASRGGGAGLPLKPAAEPLMALIQDLGAEPGRTLMVGDKPADVSTARGAGAHIAVVTYGYGELASLQSANPDFLLARFDQLVDIVE